MCLPSRPLLAQARPVVWQHPLQWCAMPPLMKPWLDEVFGFGWPYGPEIAELAELPACDVPADARPDVRRP